MREASVSEVVQGIKKLLEGEFRQVIVSGEVTNISRSHSGHWYFTLSDQSASISIALFKKDGLRNPLISKLKNGEKVICTGSIGVYAPRGTFQLIASQVIRAGKGDLIQKLEILKKKLAVEGLFDLDKKKEIPLLPEKVGVITALGGAALQDFIKIYKRRSWVGNLLVIPALVQGKGAPDSIIEALNRAETQGVSLIVLTRGGGSLEDLWAFNDEALARKISSCEIPIISAVGHETDFTICDFASDKRAETPSAAAEMITVYQQDSKQRLGQGLKNSQLLISNRIGQIKNRLSRKHPTQMASGLMTKFSRLSNRLSQIRMDPNRLVRLSDKRISLDRLVKDLELCIGGKVDRSRASVSMLQEKIHAFDPANVLKRGYSILEDTDGVVVSDMAHLQKYKKGDQFNVRFYDGVGKLVRDE